MNLFNAVELAPRDPILGLYETYNADTRSDKVNLGVGVYFTEDGKIPLLRAVQVAEKMTYKEKLELEQLNKSMPALEIKKATLTNELNNPTGDYTAITTLSAQLALVTAELEAAELRWLELSEKL